jgi:hypothetical protein
MINSVIDKLVDQSINKINQDFFLEVKIETSPEAKILELLDSMQVVAFLVELEEGIEEHFKLQLSLVDDIELLKEEGPLRTVGKLKSYLNVSLGFQY